MGNEEEQKLLMLLKNEQISSEVYYTLKQGLLGQEAELRKKEALEYWERTRQEREDYHRRHDTY